MIAAGGIMDGAGIAAALALGARRGAARHGLRRLPGIGGRRGLPAALLAPRERGPR